MTHHNALLIFAHSPKITRGNTDGTLAMLPWEDIDSLLTATIGDFVRNACGLVNVDILLYRNSQEISDDYFLPFQQRLQMFELSDMPLSEQIHNAIDDAFRRGYQNVVAVLENNPLLSRTLLRKVFTQLGHEDDCLVVGPTNEGKCFLVGMKTNHSKIFDNTNGDPLSKPLILIRNICSIETMLYLLNPVNSIDSTDNLMLLMKNVDAHDKTHLEFPSKSYAAFKAIEKKYKLKNISE